MASKCIDAISSLKDDTCDAIDLKVLDVDVISRPEWQVYQHAMTDQLATIPALAFVADMLKSARKENEWAPKIAHIFQRAMDSIGRWGLLEKALEAEKSKSPDTVLRRTQIIKIVLAGARYRVLQCKRQLLSTGNPSKEATACFQDVESVVRRLWQVDESGSPSKSSIKVRVSSAGCAGIPMFLTISYRHTNRLCKSLRSRSVSLITQKRTNASFWGCSRHLQHGWLDVEQTPHVRRNSLTSRRGCLSLFPHRGRTTALVHCRSESTTFV